MEEIAQNTTTNEPDKNPTAKKDAKIQEVENVVDQDVLELDIDVDSVTFAEQTGKEPESKESAGNGNNNNNSNITPKKDQTPRTNKKTIKSPDHRKTCFFPSPKSSNATIATAEDHKRQLNVHGLATEFMGPTARGVQDHALYQLFRKLRQEKIGELGIDIKQYHIIGARPVRRSLSNVQDPIMRVTLDSKDTKNRVVNAAMTVNLWGFKNKKEAFLRDIPPEKRSQTDERKHPPEKRSQTDDRKRSTKRKRSSSQEDKNAPQKAKKAGDRDPPKAN